MLISMGLITSVAAGMFMVSSGSVHALPFLMMVLGSMLCMIGLYLKEVASRMLIASYNGVYPKFSYRFCEEDIRITYQDREVNYSYAYILRLLEMSGYLFMFMKDGQLYILRSDDVQLGYMKLKEWLNTKCANIDVHNGRHH